jgi:hypothetical protein
LITNNNPDLQELARGNELVGGSVEFGLLDRLDFGKKG